MNTVKNTYKSDLRIAYLIVIIAFFAFSCKKEDPQAKYNKHIESADNYINNDKVDEARIELQNALDINPNDSDTNYKIADVFLKQGKLPQAVESLNSAINFNPDNFEARKVLASIYLAAKEYEQAENQINYMSDKNAEDTETLTLKANLIGMGPQKNNVEAIKILKKLQQKEPENVVVLASRATYELANDNVEEAERLYKRSLELKPDNNVIKMSLAELYNRQARFDEAENLIKSVVETNPEMSGLRYVFGEFLLRRGLADKALEQYKSIIEQEPKNVAARDRLYDIYITRKKNDEAKALLDDLKNKAPDDPSVKYFTARNLELEGKKVEALELYNEALSIMNNFPALFRKVGILELATGKTNQSIEHLNQALSLDENDIAARYSLARALFFKRNYSEAKSNLDKVLKVSPSHLAAKVLRADLSVIEKDPTKAEEVYTELIKVAPNNQMGYFKMAVLEETKGNFEKAAQWHKKTIGFDSNILPSLKRLISLRRKKQKKPMNELTQELKALKAESKNSLAEFDLMIGTLTLADKSEPERLKKGRESLNSAIKNNPNLIGAYFALAAIDSAGGDLEGAQKNYERLLEKNPKHTPTLMMLAMSQESQKKYTDASETYNRILDFAPNFAPAANNLAWLMAEELKGDVDKALKLAQIAKEQMPNESSVTDTLGWIHVLKGNTKLGVEFIKEAIEQDKENNKRVNPEILYHLAKANLILEDKTSALENINKALEVKNHPKYDKFIELKNSIK